MIKDLVHTPEGVRDIYGAEEQRKLYLENCLKNVISNYGYEDIQTPTFEYFDVFSKEIGTTPSKELYKFFDKEGDTLVLRPDFTPSVARSVAKYFENEKNPIKLTYLGNTFINNSNLQGKLKEVTEVGVEYFNDNSALADAETLNLIIDCLKSTGLNDFQICIGHMEYFKGLCESAWIGPEDELKLREYISVKNVAAAKDLINLLVKDDGLKELLLNTCECAGDISVISKAKENVAVCNNRSFNALTRLEEIYKLLESTGNEKYVSFDLSILSKYNYYTGIIFKVYTYGLGDVLVKGGRYDNLVSCFGNAKPAIGFMVVVDDLLMALRGQNINVPIRDKARVIKYNDKNMVKIFKEADSLRKKGEAVTLVNENMGGDVNE